jgi:DNA-binding TFAR19-related protein (PDSD5 family)
LASVLVLATDPTIESLLGELVAFAGHRPLYDVTLGAGGESLRRLRPDVALLDADVSAPVLSACLAAADEVGCKPVLLSSTESESELKQQARAIGVLYFPLPAGPKPLARILAKALAGRASAPVVSLPEIRTRPSDNSSLHAALCAALASVARSRILKLRAQHAATENRRLQQENGETVESLRSGAALRAAVTDYARQLRAERVPEMEAVQIVADVLTDCAAVVAAEHSVDGLLRDTEEWTRAAYGGRAARESIRELT